MSDYTATASWTNGQSPGSRIGWLLGSIDRDVLSMIAVRIAMALGGVVASGLTARCLSPSRRGEYFLVYTLAQTLAQFGNFGLQSSNTYLVARDRSLAGPLLANSVWTALIAGGVGSVIVILILKAHSPLAESGLWFAAVLAPATLFYLLGVNLLVGLRRIGTFNRFQLASTYVVLLCLIGAAIAGAGPSGFLAASALGWVVVSCGLLLALLRDGANGSLRFRPDVFGEGFRFALKAYATTLCGFLVVRSNVFLLNALTSSAQVGYYSVASQMADVMGILPQSMALVLFPALIMASGGQFRTTLKNMAVVGVLLAGGCATVGLFSEPFVRVVFGADFLPTVPVLRWMLPGVFFLGLTAMPSQYLAASGFPVAVVLVWVGGSLFALSMGSLFIPVSAGVGAAMALSLTHFGMFIAIFTLSARHARRASGRAGGGKGFPSLVAEGVLP